MPFEKGKTTEEERKKSAEIHMKMKRNKTTIMQECCGLWVSFGGVVLCAAFQYGINHRNGIIYLLYGVPHVNVLCEFSVS